MSLSQSTKFTFGDFDDFITNSFEELYTYEKIFRNQLVIEAYNELVGRNQENLRQLFFELTAVQCNQQFLENCEKCLGMKLQELDRRVTCFENHFRGPEYFTPKDTPRVDLYNFLLCVRAKLANVQDMVEELNSEVKEMKKNLNKEPMEKLAQIMMKHLNLLEGIDAKILCLQDQIQRVIFLGMVVMKRFNLKLKTC